MKKIKYVLIAILVMIINVGVVNAAASVSVPSSIEVAPGASGQIQVSITDMLALMDIATSDSSTVRVDTEYLDLKTDGSGTVTGYINIYGVKEGTATITITSSDAAEFSSGEEYNFPRKTVTVTVKQAAVTPPVEDPTPGEDTPVNPGEETPSSGNTTGESSSTSSSTSATPKNPKTGVEDYALVIAGILVIGTVGFIVVRKKDLFNRI